MCGEGRVGESGSIQFILSFHFLAHWMNILYQADRENMILRIGWKFNLCIFHLEWFDSIRMSCLFVYSKAYVCFRMTSLEFVHLLWKDIFSLKKRKKSKESQSYRNINDVSDMWLDMVSFIYINNFMQSASP